MATAQGSAYNAFGFSVAQLQGDLADVVATKLRMWDRFLTGATPEIRGMAGEWYAWEADNQDAIAAELAWRAMYTREFEEAE
jgi:hypothetical protein